MRKDGEFPESAGPWQGGNLCPAGPGSEPQELSPQHPGLAHIVQAVGVKLQDRVIQTQLRLAP